MAPDGLAVYSVCAVSPSSQAFTILNLLNLIGTLFDSLSRSVFGSANHGLNLFLFSIPSKNIIRWLFVVVFCNLKCMLLI